MMLCPLCLSLGYCQNRRTPIVAPSALKDGEFVRGIKHTARQRGVCASEWPEYATNLYRDYPGWIFDPHTGEEVFLDMEPLYEAPIEWWRDFCVRPCSPRIVPRVRREAIARVVALASILRACFPAEALLWGKTPANDNDPALLSSR